MKRLAKEQPIDVGRVQRKPMDRYCQRQNLSPWTSEDSERQTWGDKIEKTFEHGVATAGGITLHKAHRVINLMIGPVLAM
jgi:hypothetical protein